MYARLWGLLPGPLAVRLVTALLLLAAVVVVLFAWVFPWVSERLPIDNTGADQVTSSGGTNR